MANEEQLSILKQGFRAWNEWREENENIKVDLSGAFLPGETLTSAVFRVKTNARIQTRIS